MEYKRQHINVGCFADILPDGVTLTRKLDLPTIKFKDNGISYEITDIRPLNERAVFVFQTIMDEIAADRETLCCGFDATGVSEMDIALVQDIIMALEVKAKKRGKDGFEMAGALLVQGVKLVEGDDDETKTLYFDLIEENVIAIHDQIAGGNKISLQEIAKAIVRRWRSDFFC